MDIIIFSDGVMNAQCVILIMFRGYTLFDL